jgi:hypothetical protein
MLLFIPIIEKYLPAIALFIKLRKLCCFCHIGDCYEYKWTSLDAKALKAVQHPATQSDPQVAAHTVAHPCTQVPVQLTQAP